MNRYTFKLRELRRSHTFFSIIYTIKIDIKHYISSSLSLLTDEHTIQKYLFSAYKSHDLDYEKFTRLHPPTSIQI